VYGILGSSRWVENQCVENYLGVEHRKMSNETKFEIVRKFMSSNFPDFAIDSREESGRYRFELTKADTRHLILVSREFLDAFEAWDIHMRLSNYNVAAVAQSLGEFPILITTNGCIFDPDLLV
jgi:hypothetical protein